MEYTGERCLPGIKGHELLELEHRTRYMLARDLARDGAALDLGSGAGYGAALLAEAAATVVGADLSEEAVSFASNTYARANLKFVVADLCADDLVERIRAAHPEPFSLITCFEVIEHIYEPVKMLDAARTLLKPDGVFLVSTPNIDFPYDVDHNNPHHVIEYTLDEFRQLLESRFQQVTVTGQQVHLCSTVGCEPNTPITPVPWRLPGKEGVKYFVGMCSNSETPLEGLSGCLLTSDAHLKVLQSALHEVRLDREVKGQHIRGLEENLKDFRTELHRNIVEHTRQIAHLEGDANALKTRLDLSEKNAAAQRERLDISLREMKEQNEHLNGRIEELSSALDKATMEFRREREKTGQESGRRHNQLRRELEMLRNHPAMRRLLRLRTPGLKLLGLFGLDFTSKLRAAARKVTGKKTAKGAQPCEQDAPLYCEDNRPYGEIVSAPLCSAENMMLLSQKAADKLRRQLLKRGQNTLVSIIMPTYNRASCIGRAIESVASQSYKNWELLVVDDGSDDNTQDVVAAYAKQYPRIRYTRIDHEGVSAARDTGLHQAKGDIIAYLDSDNRWLRDYLLFSMHALDASKALCAYSGLRIIDEDQGNAVSYRIRRFEMDTLLKNNYVDINIFVHRKDLFHSLGGFDRSLRRWVDWDLILRYVHHHRPAQAPVVQCEYFRKKKLNQITLDEPNAYKYKVLNKHLIDWGQLKANVAERVSGLTSIIIPVYNLGDVTEDCVRSIVALTQEAPYEIILVNNGSDAATCAVLNRLDAELEQFRVVHNYENYMFALGNNLGAAASTGEYVVFLNNDTMATEGWLGRLMAPLQDDPSTGMTGPKLLYEDGTVQHAGMVFSEHSCIAYHVYRRFPATAPCVNKPRAFQAMTAACIAMRAVDYIAVGGFDPVYINGGEDLDLCFKVRHTLNKQLLYVPESVVYHLESKTPGRAAGIRHNRTVFYETWGTDVAPDDKAVYEEDGYAVVEYHKRGNDPDGPTASYIPEIHAVSPRAVAPPDPEETPVKTLNIGIVSIWYVRGVTLVAKQLAEALECDTVNTHVFARWESEHFCNEGPVFHPRVYNGGDDPTPEEMQEWVKTRRLDAVLFLEVHPKDWKRVDAVKKLKVPVIVYEHLDVLRHQFFDRYDRCDAFLHVAFHNQRVFRERHPNVPSLVIPWGIPATGGAPITAPRNLDCIRFVHVAGWGGWNNRKNTDVLLRAWERAAPKNAILVLYSQAPKERYGSECERILRECPTIEWHEGTIPDIMEAYANADMLLWPSKREGLGLPIVEALACGLPVLIADGYMMKQWMIPDRHGVVCPALPEENLMFLPEMQVDCDTLASHITALCANPARISAMGEQVRQDRDLWTWSWQARTLREQLRLIIEGDSDAADPALGYLPQRWLDFERERRAAFGEQPG